MFIYAQLEQKLKIIVGVQLISVLAFVIFWSGYFLSPYLSWEPPQFYTGFPHALPFPDGLLVLLMILAGMAILQGRRLGRQLTLLVGALFLVLGITGFYYPLQESILLTSMITMLKSGFVNLWCVVFGFYFMLKLRQRREK